MAVLSLSCQFNDSEPELVLATIDVGQGLSQILQLKSEALLFDIGPSQSAQQWYNGYLQIGKPFLNAIIISHRDSDHSGGLEFLDSMVYWSGLIIASKHEDTGYIKSLCDVSNGVKIVTICQGEIINLLPGVEIRCIWPPCNIVDPCPVQDESINRYSLAFQIFFKKTSIMLTSDIDSVAANRISGFYRQELNSDILVVPHHGSAGSLNRVFLGYIQPQIAVISCAKDNQYNHPSIDVIGFLSTTGAQIRTTYMNKTIIYYSNGFYWHEYQ